MNNKKFYLILTAVVIVIIIIAIVIIKNSNKVEDIVAPPVIQDNGNSTTPIPIIIPEPLEPVIIGKTAFAKESGVKIYYKSPFVVYKVASKNEWVGIVKGIYGAYYLLDTGSGADKIVVMTGVKLS